MKKIIFNSRFRLLFLEMAFFLASTAVLRAILIRCYAPAGSLRHAGLAIFWVGERVDLATVFVLFLPLALWLGLLPEKMFSSRLHRWALKLYFFISIVKQLFVLKSDFEFFDEFNARFNTVAIDYLLYPQEVFVNIWDSYPIVKILTLCLLGGVLVTFLGWTYLNKTWDKAVSLRDRALFLALYIFLGGIFVQTVSYNSTRITNDRIINEISANGPLSLIHAFLTRHLDYPAFYRTIPKEDAYRRARELVKQPGDVFTGDPYSLERVIPGKPNHPPVNLVVILVESFGSDFWGVLGRTPSLTPEMDKLSLKGMLFTNLYASGNRTVRGMEGVLSSFPPLPGDSIVKRDLSDDVASLAGTMKAQHYETLFLYGGRGLFDGMRSYALRNDYDRFIEQKDFKNPTFTTIWGVADEDLMHRAIEEFNAFSSAGKPFFATVLTVSNHKPYTYPTGRIAENPKDHERNNAVKYTDWALGDFFRRAEKEPFYKNTIFVVVADHGARVYGSQTIPIHSYQIPCIMVGPGVKPGSRCATLGSSLDVGPTLFGFAGFSYRSTFFGRDLNAIPANKGWAVMNHNRDISLFDGNQLAVLGLNKTIEFYEMDAKNKSLNLMKKPWPVDTEIEKNATALYQVADDLYMTQKYFLFDKQTP